MARYFLRFRHTDTGLTPTLTFVKASDLSALTAPLVYVATGIAGTYFFDYSPTFDVIFEADGGASITDVTIRYISDTLGPRDIFVDERTSQVKDDVWNDPNGRVLGTKGYELENAGTGGGGGGGGPSADVIATAVWDKDLSSYTSTGSALAGKLLENNYDSLTTLASETAVAVWNEQVDAHNQIGSVGQAVQFLNWGTAQGASATTILLASGASSANDFYKNALLVVTDGPGAGQARAVTGYLGSTRAATIDRAWGVLPTNISRYMVLPAATPSVNTAGIAAAVWDQDMATHNTSGTAGSALLSGGTTGAGVSFYSNGDTVAPFIVLVASPSHTQVRITFSEAVVMTTGANGALNVNNYQIPGLTVLNVTSLSAQQVMLTTSTQTANFLYSLGVTSIQDLQGNTIV